MAALHARLATPTDAGGRGDGAPGAWNVLAVQPEQLQDLVVHGLQALQLLPNDAGFVGIHGACPGTIHCGIVRLREALIGVLVDGVIP